MRFYPHKSVTFIELLIAMILLTAVVLAINNITIFSRYQLVSSDRRAKLQHDASRCLEHITKYASQAIGNETVYGVDSAVRVDSVNHILDVFVDSDGDGLRDVSSTPQKDAWIRYGLVSNSFNYYANCGDGVTPACGAATETIANDITEFILSKSNLSSGYVNVTITSCWNPGQPCGTSDNPSVSMSTTISLPSISTN